MAENTAEARIQDIRDIDHVLRNEAQLAGIKRISDIAISDRRDEGTSGWILHGRSDNGWDTTVKLAKDPEEETGPHYVYNAQMLQEASSRTLFVPLFFGHGTTEVPGVEGQFPYIAMEQIKGKTLKDIMNTIDIQGSLDILRTVARGVDEMLPIVSTDLKPSNILIREQNDRPVLIDFDIARKEGEINGADNGKIAGSLLYAGPDLVKKEGEITKELNVWQLGAIAFEMLTQERFMNMEHPVAAVYRYSSEEAFNEFLDIRLDKVGLPSTTRKVLAKALSYNHEDRYHSATEFATELDTAERQYIKSTRRKEGHTVKRPVSNILSHVVTPRRGPDTHEHRDSVRPQKGHIPRHRLGPKHRRVNSI